MDEIKELLLGRVICLSVLQASCSEFPREDREDLLGWVDHHDLAKPLHSMAERATGQIGLHKHRE